jgi:osmotically inducible protein OsmC
VAFTVFEGGSNAGTQGGGGVARRVAGRRRHGGAGQRRRFGDGSGGTNPEELIAAAHAGCFSMALSNLLATEGHPPTAVTTTADVSLDKTDDGFAITKITLHTVGDVPGLSADEFQEYAAKAKVGCAVSKALAATPIELDARLA